MALANKASKDAAVMDLQPERMALARALIAYLRRFPTASDSLEGIHRWWLGSPPVRLDGLLLVLQWMRDKQVIEEVHAADGRQRFRCCASDAQLQALSQLLGEPGELH